MKIVPGEEFQKFHEKLYALEVQKEVMHSDSIYRKDIEAFESLGTLEYKVE